MTVRVRMKQGGGSGNATSFSDNFTGTALGPDWTVGAWRRTNDANNRFLLTVGANAVTFSNDGGGDGQIQSYLCPTVLGAINSSDQFSQATFAANNNGGGAGTFTGPTCFMAPSASGAYIMTYYLFAPDVPNSRWILWQSLVGTSLNVPGLATALAVFNQLPALTNVARLEARVNGAQVDLICKVNGITGITFSDVTADRSVNGVPGLGGVFISTAGSLNSWSTWSGGAL